MDRLVVTGAAGRIGSVLREGLRGVATTVVLLDREPLTAEPGEAVVTCDIADLVAVRAACRGAEAIVHLAGIPEEAVFPAILHANIEGTWTVYEAARREGVGRVVFASSNHAIGMTPVAEPAPAEPFYRPDTFYGVSKVFGEATGRLYFDKFGVESACLRIGSFLERPTLPRHLSTWLSPADTVRLVRACLEAPRLGFAILYGVSNNRRAFWDLTSARALGYDPQDDAETYAGEIEAGGPGEFQGGPYADPDFTP